MATLTTLEYLGDLRTEMIHVPSGSTIITDAPVDNHGKGEAFSPTDLVAAAMISCMVTVMGIYAQNNNLNLGVVSGSVVKDMAASPRRIRELTIEIHCEGANLTDTEKKALENVALNCPVANSLHPDIKYPTRFVYE